MKKIYKIKSGKIISIVCNQRYNKKFEADLGVGEKIKMYTPLIIFFF